MNVVKEDTRLNEIANHKIVDVDVKGNQVFLFLTKEVNPDYWGDDWNDPYDNAGVAYSEFYEDIIAIHLSYKAKFIDGDTDNDGYHYISKSQMKDKKMPAIIIYTDDDAYDKDEGEYYSPCLEDWEHFKNSVMIFFETSLKDVLKNMDDLGVDYWIEFLEGKDYYSQIW